MHACSILWMPTGGTGNLKSTNNAEKNLHSFHIMAYTGLGPCHSARRTRHRCFNDPCTWSFPQLIFSGPPWRFGHFVAGSERAHPLSLICVDIVSRRCSLLKTPQRLFSKVKVDYLDAVIWPGRFGVSDLTTKSIEGLQSSSNVTELHSSLGLCHIYDACAMCLRIAAPLTMRLQKDNHTGLST